MFEIGEVRQLVNDLQYPLEYEDSIDWHIYPKANCYVYALGLPINHGLLIGDLIGKRRTHGDPIDEIIETFKEEVEELGFWVVECETDDYVEDDCFKLYIEFDMCNNYHFLRENADGTWSHKSAGDVPNQTDMYGNVILDPEVLAEVSDDVGYCFMLCKV
ncbi:MAG: hypothetical protein IJ629_07510 [Clostridia bacterium]|nr:hypothetical protein [Clostridia bacterium]